MANSLFDESDDKDEKSLSWTERYIFNMFNKLIIEEKISERMATLVLFVSTVQNTLLLFSATYTFMDHTMKLADLRGEYLVLKSFRRLSYLASPLDLLEILSLAPFKNILFFVTVAIGYFLLAMLVILSIRVLFS